MLPYGSSMLSRRKLSVLFALGVKLQGTQAEREMHPLGSIPTKATSKSCHLVCAQMFIPTLLRLVKSMDQMLNVFNSHLTLESILPNTTGCPTLMPLHQWCPWFNVLLMASNIWSTHFTCLNRKKQTSLDTLYEMWMGYETREAAECEHWGSGCRSQSCSSLTLAL